MPGFKGPIMTVRIDCPLSGWIPDSTRYEAIHVLPIFCAAWVFPNKRYSQVSASPEATVGLLKTFVRVNGGGRAEIKLTRLNCSWLCVEVTVLLGGLSVSLRIVPGSRANRNVWFAASPQAKCESVTGWSAQMYTAFVGVDHSWPGWNALRSFPH